MAKLIVDDLDVNGKKVLMRVDFNVPIKDGVIGDDNRIVAALPTIKYIIEHGGKAILLSHLGRVKSDADKKELSLKPVAERLSELLKKPVTFVPSNEGKEVEDAINAMKDGDVVVLETLDSKILTMTLVSVNQVTILSLANTGQALATCL